MPLPRIVAHSSYYAKATPATAHTSSAATVIFVIFFVAAGAVGLLAIRTVLSRRHRTSADDDAPFPAQEEQPPKLQEVWIQHSDSPQHAWDTLTPISATRIPETTEAPTSQPLTNPTQGQDIVQAPQAKYPLVQVAVLISMPSEQQGDTITPATERRTPSEVDATADDNARKCPDVAFGISTLRYALDDS